MSETIRLSKVLKELNISIDRAVDFLSEKGVQVDRSPNTKIDQDTYSILVKEFQSDAKQKAASEEVVINKIPERKPETPKKEEPTPAPPQPEKITTSKVELEGPKTIGKIDLEKLNQPKPKPVEKKEEKPVAKETEKPEAKVEAKPEEKPVEKEKPKTEEKPTPPKEEVKKEIKEAKKETGQEQITPEAPKKIETKYQKLEGPNFTGKKLDLSEFEKDKKLAEDRKEKQKQEKENKKKRKRIRKDVKLDDVKPGDNQNQNRPFKSNNRPARRPQAELSDEEVSKQIKETLEKLTNKGVKSKGSKHRRDKRKERREMEAMEMEAMEKDKTLQVTEFVTVNELASLMDVSVTEVISACMSLGIMVTMNQRLEADTIQLVADDFGYDVKFTNAEEESAEEQEEDKP